jgi:hypothetical protein
MTWLPSFSQHGGVKFSVQNDDDVSVNALELRITWLVRAKIKMGEAIANLIDTWEDGWDRLLH